MLQKITSWFRLNLPQRGSIKESLSLKNLGRELREFYHDHPRLGGGIVISLLIILMMLGFYGWNLTPVRFGAKDLQVLKIPYGASLREVGQTLEKHGLIRSGTVYEIYVRLKPARRMAKAGYYQLCPGMSLPRIVRELRLGIPPSIRVTIPEGLTSGQVADLLAQKGLVDRERFLSALQDFNFINEVLGDFKIKSSAEGYLFPDTYNFVLTGSNEREIIRKMLSRFKEVYQQNFGKMTAEKRREVVIIASLVEKEAKKAAERPVIAGIFYNRLRIGYPLQSCATVEYSLGKHKERLYYKDLQVNSPYNTYLHQGLPPGPIANPGLASLKAAVSPAKVRYLYFVAKPDGTHVFSLTYQQHLAAQRKIGVSVSGGGI
ncbi:MAG: endolytic transglycosylase MltG [Bacillota bacterium]